MSTISPNMGLIIPTIGTDTGLQWEQGVDASLITLDSHNHSPGSGVQITPAGMNINATLNFNGNTASNIYGLLMTGSAASSVTGFLYTAPSSGGGINDLFYNDYAGNVIQLTKAGVVNSTAASIPGESYAAGTFTWKQGAGSTIPANFDIGGITIRPTTAGTTNGITITPPAGISTAYGLALPALPSSQKIMTLDNSGNIIAPYSLDNSTIVATSNVIQVPTGGITSTQIASGTVVALNIAAGTITTTQISSSTILGSNIASNTIAANNGVAITNATATSSSYTNSTTSLTNIVNQTFSSNANGRPVMFSFSGSFVQVSASSSNQTATFELINTTNSVVATTWTLSCGTGGASAFYPATSFNYIGQISGAATSRNYALQAACTNTGTTITIAAGLVMNIVQL